VTASQQPWAVDAAAAGGEDERPLVEREVAGLPGCAAEVAAVVKLARQLLVERVVVGEIGHARVAVDADSGVALTQHVVDTRLRPEPADEAGLVDDVAEAGDRPAAANVEPLERR
jgi:hypothetical protein